MGVPVEIRRVPRPKNTVVVDSEQEGPKRYKVRARKGYTISESGNCAPVNGVVVGYISDGMFIEARPKAGSDGPDSFSYGGATIAYSLSKDVFEDLVKIFDVSDCISIMSISMLKMLHPRVTASRLSTFYRKSFVSQYYPSAAMSKNSISNLYQRLGMDTARRQLFFDQRLKAVAAEHHLAIDGTLREDNSIVNDLSSYSYKSREKHVSDVSIIYAYDIENMEPICCSVYPGCKVDSSAFESFLKNNNITKGILIADKAFTPNNIRKILEGNKNLHYITPMKRNDSRVKLYDMLKYTGVLKGIYEHVEYKKCKTQQGLYLYMFKDFNRYCKEKQTFLEKVKNNQASIGDDYDFGGERFGTILLESDMDMEPLDAYKCYRERWKLEMFFREYKQDDCITTTNVQNDYSVHGMEFVNFIATLITSRLVSRFEKSGLLENHTYASLLEELNFAWRKVTDAEPVSYDKYWINADEKTFEILEALGLSKPNPAVELNKKEMAKAKRLEKKAVLGTESKKKEKTPKANDKPVTEKRKPGRPRVRPLPDPNAPKRGLGRPRTRAEKDPNLPKRGRGRPKKSESVNNKAE